MDRQCHWNYQLRVLCGLKVHLNSYWLHKKYQENRDVGYFLSWWQFHKFHHGLSFRVNNCQKHLCIWKGKLYILYNKTCTHQNFEASIRSWISILKTTESNQFWLKAWLKEYIDMNTDSSKNAQQLLWKIFLQPYE